jgi:hypothetical protein
MEATELQPNTRQMHAAELKPLLKSLAAETGINLNDPAFRFTLWVENGNYFHYEDHVEHDHQTCYMLAESILKNKSRQGVLDAREDTLFLWSMEMV